MATYVVLLRAVNVGGTGKLAMADLRALCAEAGFARVRTHIASGNVVLDSEAPLSAVKVEIEGRLLAHVGKPVGVVVRTAAEMAAVVRANPFPEAAPSRTAAVFLDEPPPPDALDHAIGQNGEEMRLGAREIFVHYGAGMADSRLRIPAAAAGTARNMNTVAKLAEMASGM